MSGSYRQVVFTDLDGTLLDFSTYSPAAAALGLAALRAREVPVVFCSSKTAGEQRPLREALGLTGYPFIVENGSAILVPSDAGLDVSDWPMQAGTDAGERVRVLGRAAADIRAVVAEIEQELSLDLAAFGALGPARVAELTGLDDAGAARAVARDFSETLAAEISVDDWKRVESRLAQAGLQCRHGGRFHTVTGLGSDKGSATREVAALYRTAWGEPIETIGLGDSANDAPLLAAVDRSFLLAHEDGAFASIQTPGLIRIAQPGGRGWSEAIARLG